MPLSDDEQKQLIVMLSNQIRIPLTATDSLDVGRKVMAASVAILASMVTIDQKPGSLQQPQGSPAAPTEK